MNDDRLSWDRTREVFEAIVSQVEDPELVRMRRLLLLLGGAVLVAAIAVTVLGPVSWHGLVAFFSTFLPGLVGARSILGRRWAGSGLHERGSAAEDRR